MLEKFRALPFIYQERGQHLAALQGRDLAQMIEERDQDLENYLASLSSGGPDIYAAASVGLVGGDSGPMSVELPFTTTGPTTVHIQVNWSIDIDGVAIFGWQIDSVPVTFPVPTQSATTLWSDSISTAYTFEAGDHTITSTLSNPDGIFIGTGRTTLTAIVGNDTGVDIVTF